MQIYSILHLFSLACSNIPHSCSKQIHSTVENYILVSMPPHTSQSTVCICVCNNTRSSISEKSKGIWWNKLLQMLILLHLLDLLEEWGIKIISS